MPDSQFESVAYYLVCCATHCVAFATPIGAWCLCAKWISTLRHSPHSPAWILAPEPARRPCFYGRIILVSTTYSDRYGYGGRMRGALSRDLFLADTTSQIKPRVSVISMFHKRRPCRFVIHRRAMQSSKAYSVESSVWRIAWRTQSMVMCILHLHMKVWELYTDWHLWIW